MNLNMKADDELHKTMMFFNTRQDALTAIVKSRSDVKGQLGDLHIVQITDDEVEFAYYPPPSGERKELKIKIQPPLANAWAAKPRLKAWRDDAYKKWNVPDRPKVHYFKRPDALPYAAPAIVALGLLVFALYGEGFYIADWIRAFVGRHLGASFLKYSAYFAAVMHLIIEPIFMSVLIFKYSTPLVPALKWIACNMLVGYGALDQFRECIMYERMRVIYRHTDVGDIGPNLKGVKDVAAKKVQ